MQLPARAAAAVADASAVLATVMVHATVMDPTINTGGIRKGLTISLILTNSWLVVMVDGQ